MILTYRVSVWFKIRSKRRQYSTWVNKTCSIASVGKFKDFRKFKLSSTYIFQFCIGSKLCLHSRLVGLFCKTHFSRIKSVLDIKSVNILKPGMSQRKYFLNNILKQLGNQLLALFSSYQESSDLLTWVQFRFANRRLRKNQSPKNLFQQTKIQWSV